MTTVGASEPHSKPQSRRRWWQFSLLNLILVMAMVCALAAYFRARQELLDEKAAMKLEREKHDDRLAEIKTLKDRVGILPITDNSKVYVRAHRKTTQQIGSKFEWRWRIYLPEGTEEWNFVFVMGFVKKDGFDVRNRVFVPHRVYVPARAGRQYDVELSIERNLNGSLHNYVTLKSDDYGISRTGVVLEEDLQSLLRSVRAKGVLQSGLKLHKATVDEPLELLRVVSIDEPAPEKGLLFYVEKGAK